MIFVRSAGAAALLATVWIITGCGTLYRPALNVPHPLPVTHMEKQLRTEILQWQGVSHRMGGTNRQGIDCSAFVMQIYRSVFKIRIPRTTQGQVYAGSRVPIGQLRAGDLVFFHTATSGRHVGIYLNNGEFAHSSKSNGVIISSLSSPYWNRIYWTARRVLN